MAVPRLSFYTIDYHARQALTELQPDALTRPEPLDVRGIWEWGLDVLGAEAEVGSHEIMGHAEAWTEWSGGVPKVMLREDHHDALFDDVEATLRARSNVCHETGHVVLHGGIAERMKLSSDSKALSQGCEEWQAWAFAGCLLMPCAVIRDLDTLAPPHVAELFDVSPQMARCHLYRMQRAGMI